MVLYGKQVLRKPSRESPPMKRLRTVLTAFLVAMASAALAADTLEEAKKKGFLAVGVRDATPPMSFLDREKGEIAGVEIDLVAAVARKIGVPLKLVPVAADGRVEALQGGKVDLVAASFSKTPDREKLVDFSLTYFTTRQRILARKGAVSTLKDLEGKKIAVVKGTTTQTNLLKKVPSADVLALGNMREVIGALARGEVDIVSGDGVTLYGYLMMAPEEKKGKFEIPADITLADEPYGMAVRLGDRKFLDLVNGVLTELKSSGEAEKIFTRWSRGGPGASSDPLADYRAKSDQAHQRNKQKMYQDSRNQYDYQYDDTWWWYGGGGGGWAGYYRW
jgi:polar amino acid transport system substrate-binding protein